MAAQSNPAGVDEDQAAIARAIEESLAAGANVPSADFNDEQELQRILELSKNDH